MAAEEAASAEAAEAAADTDSEMVYNHISVRLKRRTVFSLLKFGV